MPALLQLVLAMALTSPHAAADPAAGLSIRQLAGQRVVAGFTGTSAPKSLLRRIHRGELGGVILFSQNIRSRGQLRSLTARLQRARPAKAPRLIVSIDQEGGLVKRLRGAPTLSAADMGARNDTGLARRQGAATASNLRGVGVNVDLAPVLDVGRPGTIMRRQRRSFSSSKTRVARIGGAFVRGLTGGRVAATGKHFPGLGLARENQDLRPNRITLSVKGLRAVDERPYSAMAPRLGLVMLSSAVYPAFSGSPAVFSRRVATTELRGHIGFRGASITDALDAGAMSRYGSPGHRALRAAKAGVDLFLYSRSAGGSAATNALVAAVRGGKLSRKALRDGARRALRLRAKLGKR